MTRVPKVATGLVIGKFLPPHLGHHRLIEEALALAEVVDVVVCNEVDQRPPAETRARLLSDIHPEASVHVVDDLCGWHTPDPCPDSCSAAWAEHLRAGRVGLAGRCWDVVVTSETYGERFAEELGAVHVAFDPDRSVVPARATDIRTDLAEGWSKLHPSVRRELVRKVVVVGAESTGTTSLTLDLASHLGVDPVLEFGRAHTEVLADRFGTIWDVEWTSSDFAVIADGQEEAEARALAALVDDGGRFGEQGPWLVCDTDLLATAVWHERYLGSSAPDLIERALRARCGPTLYVLTLPDGVDFEQDGLRDGEHLRHTMTERFREVLADQDVPWLEVAGDPAARLRCVTDRLAAMAPLLHQPPPAR